ncbi:MAG: Rab family GTPase [Candidatus Odinarchaeota archaeon]
MDHDSYTYTFKICLFADRNVGKDTFFKTLSKSSNYKDTIDYYRNTTGVNFAVKEVEIHDLKLQFWIFSDMQIYGIRFANLRDMYVKGACGVILMYDITNVKTLNRLSEWCKMVKKYSVDIPILLVGNKLDLEDNREVSKEQAEKFKEDNDISSWMEISLKTGHNVEKMFLNVASLTLNNYLKREGK